jgi:hypothetical protein
MHNSQNTPALPDALPKWLTVTDASATIKLSTPKELNGIKADRITLRSPTVREVRACQQMHPHDGLAADSMLFASLGNISEKELLDLTLKDYERVKVGYFRLVEEDEL